MRGGPGAAVHVGQGSARPGPWGDACAGGSWAAPYRVEAASEGREGRPAVGRPTARAMGLPPRWRRGVPCPGGGHRLSPLPGIAAPPGGPAMPGIPEAFGASVTPVACVSPPRCPPRARGAPRSPAGPAPPRGPLRTAGAWTPSNGDRAAAEGAAKRAAGLWGREPEEPPFRCGATGRGRPEEPRCPGPAPPPQTSWGRTPPPPPTGRGCHISCPSDPCHRRPLGKRRDPPSRPTGPPPLPGGSMEPEEAFNGSPAAGARGGSVVAIIGAEDEDFENDIEPNPDDQNSMFQSLELVRQHPAYLMAFLQHVVLQFDSCPVLCYLHVDMLRKMNPKEGKKQFLEFCHLFLDKAGLLRVPVPHQVQFELDRTRPELLADDVQRRYLQEIQAFQEPEISRQLEDFRSKRLMGMTPGEQELTELESYQTRDVGIREAKEKQLAEVLLARLEEMHLTISSDEEKSSAIFGAIVTYMKYLGVKTKLSDSKKSKSNFFRKKISGIKKPEELQAKSRKGFSLPGAALWNRDTHNSDFRQSKVPEGEADKATHPDRKGPRASDKIDSGAARPKAGAAGTPASDPPSVAVTINPPPGEGAEGDAGLDPPGPTELGDTPPRGFCPTEPPSSEQHPTEDGAESESLEPGGPGGGEPPQSFLPPQSEETEPRVSELELDPPTWRQLAAPDALLRLKKSEVKRQEVINELFLTEHAHVRMLRVLLEVFYQPMLKEAFFDEQELSNIFPSLEDLVEVHTVFLDSLKKLREESNYVISEIGDVLLARFEGTEGSWFQKISARFCSRQSFALDQLKAKQRKDTRFSQFIQEAESQPRCRRLQLKDIIPTEMQRLTKYPLLLHNITKCTEAAGERAKVEQAAECCRQILNHVNQEVRDMENLMKLKDYQRRLDLSNLKQSMDPLLSEFKNTDITKRNLVHEGPLTWRVTRDKAVDVHVLLLDDLLVLLQRQEERLVLRCHSRTITPTPDGKQMLSPIIKLSSAMTREVATDHKAFYVIISWENGAQIYELVAQTVSERKNWCAMISETAGSLKLPGSHRAKTARGGPNPHSPIYYREPLLSSSENGGSLKEPLSLDEREKDGAVEGTEFEGGPEKMEKEAERVLAEVLALRRPPRAGGEGALAAAALGRVRALTRLLTGEPPAAGDGAASPPEDAWEGPSRAPAEEERRDAGDGAESEGEGRGQRAEGAAAAGATPNGPRSPEWGARLAAAEGPAPPLALAPAQAAWLRDELRGLEEALRGLKVIEEDYWQLQELLAKHSSTGCLFT
ncbi:rho guanine nucleotide exchange factor 1 isoform X4 [Struthio camelus]|uniref:rho guanine nucleotide exchange factor 1 isoform X4 n=1 Tax=Struthio camelus TaxID=8801 RepID=UPI003603DEDF